MPTLRLISGWAACALAVSLILPSAAMPGPAAISPREMAAIEATAPLDDPTPSAEAVKAAIAVAVEKAARGAIARPLDDEPDARPDDRESTPPSGTNRDTDNSAYKVRL